MIKDAQDIYDIYNPGPSRAILKGPEMTDLEIKLESNGDELHNIRIRRTIFYKNVNLSKVKKYITESTIHLNNKKLAF